MNPQFAWQLDLAGSLQSLAKNRCLHSQLMLISRMLEMATSAALEVRTFRRYPGGRRRKNPFQVGAGESGFLLGESSFDQFALEHEWNEYALAWPVLVGGKPRQRIAAIDLLLNFELHALNSKCWKRGLFAQ